jgi:urea transport system ATP-binding protein
MGLLPTRSGSVLLDGQPLDGLRSDERARRGLGFVPQGRDIFPHLTVEENLQIGLVVHKRGRASDREGLEQIYTLFPVLKTMLARKGGVLSGGQQQQLAIARALLTKPKLLMLDEPTEGIQPSIIEQIGDTIKRLKTETGLTILLVEQYVDFCKEVGDHFYAMDRGAVTISGPIASLTDEVVKEHLQV